MFYSIVVIHGVNSNETGYSGQVCTQKRRLSFSSFSETNDETWKALGIVAECDGLTRADYLEQIVRDSILTNTTRNEDLTLPCNIWTKDTSPPCITPSESHLPQRNAAQLHQLEALEALRDRVLFELKLGKQATGYKVSLKALNRFISELTNHT